MQSIDLLAALRRHRLVAIVRGRDADSALDTVLAMVGQGIPLVEVSLSGAGALGVIERARSALGPDAMLGAGTVLTPQDARRAADAGASYLVTPAVTDAVAAAREMRLPVLAGAMTPTEVAAAQEMDATAVKLFPAEPGGLALLRALRGPFPDVPFVPVGGIDAVGARAYLSAGALAVGVGTPLVGRAADGDASGLGSRIAAFRALAEETL